MEIKELTLDEISKVSGGIGIDGLSQGEVYKTEIKECDGRKLMYVYDMSGNLVMVADITENNGQPQAINPDAYQNLFAE